MSLNTLNTDGFFGENGDYKAGFFATFDSTGWLKQPPEKRRDVIDAMSEMGPFIGSEAMKQCTMGPLLGRRGHELN